MSSSQDPEISALLHEDRVFPPPPAFAAAAAVRDTKPFEQIPKDPDLRKAVWAEPKLVGEVAFTEWTDEGVIRHPSFQGLREDKKAQDVIRENPS